jgi:hypothetical protein
MTGYLPFTAMRSKLIPGGKPSGIQQ